MADVLALTAFARATRGTHAIVDSRLRTSRATWPLRNDLFDVIDVPPDASEEEWRDARTAIGARAAVVVDERPARADAACERLTTRGATAATLEGGLLGWTQAIVFERADRYAEATVATVVRPARMLRSYLVLTTGGVTIVDGCGAAALLLAECERLGRLPVAIVDTAFHRDRVSCGAECAMRAEAAYWVPPAGEDHLDARTHRRLECARTIAGLWVEPIDGGRNLRLDGAQFSIGALASATYRTCCGPGSPGSTTYDAVNRGIALVDDGRRWQLEFGPPGCLPA